MKDDNLRRCEKILTHRKGTVFEAQVGTIEYQIACPCEGTYKAGKYSLQIVGNLNSMNDKQVQGIST